MQLNRWVIRFSLSATVAALGFAIACGGGGGPSGTPGPTPTPTQLVFTPGPTDSPPQTDYRLLFRESKPTEDVIWRVSPADVTQREQIATLQHREGFPIKAAISPDGTFLAVLSLPEEAVSEDTSQAVVLVVDLKTNELTQVADGIDYQYTPLWSPDSTLLYMRRYAGPEFLNATLYILRARITHKPAEDEPTPKPTPTLVPGIEPWPGIGTLEVVLQDTVANVLKFAPIGFADDNRSMFFLEAEGGTEGTSLIGIYAPATTEEVDKVHKAAESAWYAAQAANLLALQDAQNNGLPPPVDTATPVPTPPPDVRLVVLLSDQAVANVSLSPDAHSVAYLSQLFTDSGEIQNQTFVANLIEATTTPLSVQGLPVGNQLSPAWYPDGRLTVSVLPSSGPGQMAIVTLDLSNVFLLPQPESGFDMPLAWAPDGTWLAVSHMSGSSLGNPGDGRLDIVSVGGQRVTVIDGSANSGEDSVLGWLKP